MENLVVFRLGGRKTTGNIRFGNMAGRRIYSQLFFRYSASVPADERLMSSRINNDFCNFIQQRLRADDFQMPPHRQAVAVSSHTGRPIRQ